MQHTMINGFGQDLRGKHLLIAAITACGYYGWRPVAKTQLLLCRRLSNPR
jgi:hypothetical protein